MRGLPKFIRALTIFGFATMLVFAVPAHAGESAFSLVVSTPESTVKAGTDLKAAVTMTNTSDHDIFYRADPSGTLLPFAFDVRDSEGKVVSETSKGLSAHGKNMAAGSYLGVPIHPGESIHRERVLNKEFDLEKPGKYTVQATRESGSTVVKSNIITITVVP